MTTNIMFTIMFYKCALPDENHSHALKKLEKYSCIYSLNINTLYNLVRYEPKQFAFNTHTYTI